MNCQGQGFPSEEGWADLRLEVEAGFAQVTREMWEEMVAVALVEGQQAEEGLAMGKVEGVLVVWLGAVKEELLPEGRGRLEVRVDLVEADQTLA